MLFLRRPRASSDPLVNAFLRFSKTAEKRGVVRESWESPMAFVRRVSLHHKLPSAEVDEVIAGLEEQLYAAGEASAAAPGRRSSLLRALRRLRLRTSLRASM